jgi:CHAT domain-containing protein
MLRMLLALLLLAGCAHGPPREHDPLAEGVALRNQGQIRLSIDMLTVARGQAEGERARAIAGGELGASLVAARRLGEARRELESAVASLDGADRARYLLDLGGLELIEHRPEAARARFEQARALSANDVMARATAEVQLARVLDGTERVALIESTSHALDEAGAMVPGRLHLALGARALEQGSLALEAADHHLGAARSAALATHDAALLLEADDALAQRYEDADRLDEAARLVDEALESSRHLAPGAAGLAHVQLLWRQGRLASRAHRPELARAAYLRAVEEVEALRPDIPIEYEDGQSSFRKTLSPIYLGLADLLLKQASSQPRTEQQETLKQVRNIVELLKQTELQDYLGDRCVVAAEQGGGIAEGSAILYPIVFADRLEILLETKLGIARFTTQVTARTLTRVAVDLAGTFRAGPRGGMDASRQIYDWLVRPLEPAMRAESISTLVIVPDGVLRLVPLAALHDGERYLIERVAVATIPGLSMTNVAPAGKRSPAALVAGLSEPGPVVDRLPKRFVESLGGEATRSPGQMKDALSLPGVKREVEGVARLMPGDVLIDGEFTAKGFERQFTAGRYGVVHIASHGVFGGSASESFIMTYDELLTMDKLQALLGESAGRNASIDLLTLSACETAEGDDRSPLGISGAALKAHARSAIGSLWPVEDTAAEIVMQAFYNDLRRGATTKAQAMRQAQLKLLRDPRYAHPFFWAPFIIIGNWL